MGELRPGDASWVDERADRFERAWRAGQRPRIGDFLGDATGPRRAGLIEELARVEGQLRAEAREAAGGGPGLRPSPGDAGPGPAPARATRGDADAGAGRDLLLGLLALQNDFIGRDALVTAFTRWVADRSRPLGRHLLDGGVVDAETLALLEALARKHLALHGDDPGLSLAALDAPGVARSALESLGDPALRASLCLLATRPGAGQDPFVTRCGGEGPSGPAGPRYRVLAPHGEGGLGRVSVARDEELHRDVALKEIRERYADDPVSRSRFLVEAEITGNLEHPGVVPVYGLGHYDDGRPFYAMRFIKGESLHRAIEQFHAGGGPGSDPGGRSLALRGLLQRFLDACNAVAYAHSRGVLHRDLKPRNIMLGPFGETLVVDWGMAKSVGRKDGTAVAGEGTLRPESGGEGVTRAGDLIGTPAFMSPEQACGHLDRLGWACDVYGLGATLYCLLTGRAPFDDRDLDALLEQVRRGEFPPPRAVVRATAPALEAICLKAMALAPEARYASAGALADDLEHWLAGEPVSVFRDRWPARLGRWSRRHRWAVPAAAGVALALLLVPSAGLVIVREVAKREAVESKYLLARGEARAREQAAQDFHRALRAHIAASNESRQQRSDRRPGATSRALARLTGVWQDDPIPDDPMNLRGEIVDCLGEAEVGWFRDPEGRLLLDQPIRALAVSRDGRRLAVAQAPSHGVDHLRKVLILGFDGGVNRPGESHFAIRSELRWGQEVPPAWPTTGPGRRVDLPGVARALRSYLAAKLEVARELAISPDGRRVALGTSAGDLHLWDLEGDGPGRPPVRWRAHAGGLRGLVFGRDSRSLFSAGDDGVLARWDLAGEPGVRPEAGPRHAAGSRIGRLVTIDGGRRLFAARDGRLCEFAADSLACRDTGVDLSRNRPDVLGISPDGRFAAVASEAGVDVIALEGGVRVRTLARAGLEGKDRPPGNPSAVQFDPSGLLLLVTSAGPSYPSRSNTLWDLATGREVLTLGAREGEQLVASFAPDGRHLFTTDHRAGHEQWILFAYPVVTARARATLALTARPSTSVALAPDGSTLARLSIDPSTPGDRRPEVTLWDASDGRLLRRRVLDGSLGRPGENPWLAFDPAGGRLAVVESGGVLLWDLAAEGEVRRIETGRVRPFRSFPSDGRIWGAIGEGADARLVHLDVDRPGSPAASSPSAVDRIPTDFNRGVTCFAAQGGLALVGVSGGTVEVFREGEVPARVASWGGLMENVPVWCVATSPDGKLAAIGNRSGQIQVRRLPGGEIVGEAHGHARGVGSLAFSSDGRRLASGSHDGSVRVWRLAATGPSDPLVLPTGSPGVGGGAVGFSPDGRRLWTWAANENAVQCWRLDRLEDELRHLGGRLEEVLKGEATPGDAQERLRLAEFCYKRSLYATATRFFEEAFAAEPPLAEDVGSYLRYNAACCAALAGEGRGRDDPMPDGATRAALREEALGWLRADLAGWAGVLGTGEEAGRRKAVEDSLARWMTDGDLAGIRDDPDLIALPREERDACRALWSDVAGLARKAVVGPQAAPPR